MPNDRELLQQALAEILHLSDGLDAVEIIQAIKARLAQPEHESVGMYSSRMTPNMVWYDKPPADASQLYTAPQKKEWVGLTDEELTEMRSKIQEYMPMHYIQYGLTIQNAMEEKLREKNGMD